MLKLLFKTTAYYVIWQKFKKQILLILGSIILIGFIGIIYEDLFEVMKVNDKENIGLLLFFKWLLISGIIAFNIYILRKTKIENKDFKVKDEKLETSSKTHTKKEEKIIKKKGELFSTTDLILKKYGK